MGLIFALIAIGAGIGSAIESGANQTLLKSLNSTLWTAAAISLVTMISSVALLGAAGTRSPGMAALGTVPWWGWIGGLFGLLVVTSSTVMSLALDNFGWMGFDVRPASIGRLAGAALMIAGVSCIAIF